MARRFEARQDGTLWFIDEDGNEEQVPREQLRERYLAETQGKLKIDPGTAATAEMQAIQAEVMEKLAELSKDGPINLGARAGGGGIDFGR